MIRRFAFLLPIIAVMISVALPAEAVTLPNICSQGKWISCGQNAYYCTAMKRDSCKVPTFVAPRRMENWSQKQKTSTVVPKGSSMKSTTSKYRYKYVTRKVCKYNSKGIRYCRFNKVRVALNSGNKLTSRGI